MNNVSTQEQRPRASLFRYVLIATIVLTALNTAALVYIGRMISQRPQTTAAVPETVEQEETDAHVDALKSWTETAYVHHSDPFEALDKKIRALQSQSLQYEALKRKVNVTENEITNAIASPDKVEDGPLFSMKPGDTVELLVPCGGSEEMEKRTTEHGVPFHLKSISTDINYLGSRLRATFEYLDDDWDVWDYETVLAPESSSPYLEVIRITPERVYLRSVRRSC